LVSFTKNNNTYFSTFNQEYSIEYINYLNNTVVAKYAVTANQNIFKDNK